MILLLFKRSEMFQMINSLGNPCRNYLQKKNEYATKSSKKSSPNALHKSSELFQRFSVQIPKMIDFQLLVLSVYPTLCITIMIST